MFYSLNGNEHIFFDVDHFNHGFVTITRTVYVLAKIPTQMCVICATPVFK